MSRYIATDTRTWEPVDVRGTVMEKCALWNDGFDVQSSFFRMPEGCVIRKHVHMQWVQVAVLEGEMQIESEQDGTVRLTAGGCYVMKPGEGHVETAVRDTVVLVTQLNRHPDYQVQSTGAKASAL